MKYRLLRTGEVLFEIAKLSTLAVRFPSAKHCSKSVGSSDLCGVPFTFCYASGNCISHQSMCAVSKKSFLLFCLDNHFYNVWKLHEVLLWSAVQLIDARTHAATSPTTFSSSLRQLTDVLYHLAFQRRSDPFTGQLIILGSVIYQPPF